MTKTSLISICLFFAAGLVALPVISLAKDAPAAGSEIAPQSPGVSKQVAPNNKDNASSSDNDNAAANDESDEDSVPESDLGPVPTGVDEDPDNSAE